MKYSQLSLTILSMVFATNGFSQIGPNADEVEIKNITIDGSGCPSGSVNALLTSSESNGPKDTVAITYDDFKVEKPGESNKYCNIQLDLEYPTGWSYTFINSETNGYTKVQSGHRSALNLEYFWSDAGPLKIKKNWSQNGYWVGGFTFNANFGRELWSPCNKRFPVSLKSTLKLIGKADDPTLVSTLKTENTYSQMWKIRWKKC